MLPVLVDVIVDYQNSIMDCAAIDATEAQKRLAAALQDSDLKEQVMESVLTALESGSAEPETAPPVETDDSGDHSTG